MSLSVIAGLNASISTIIGGLVYFTKFADSKLTKTQAEKQSETAKLEQDEAAVLKETGRPKWD